MKKKLEKYRVLASETVYYDFEVEAYDQEDADQKAIDHVVSDKDISDAEGFEFEATKITD
jgi:hypothetical protein